MTNNTTLFQVLSSIDPSKIKFFFISSKDFTRNGINRKTNTFLAKSDKGKKTFYDYSDSSDNYIHTTDYGIFLSVKNFDYLSRYDPKSRGDFDFMSVNEFEANDFDSVSIHSYDEIFGNIKCSNGHEVYDDADEDDYEDYDEDFDFKKTLDMIYEETSNAVGVDLSMLGNLTDVLKQAIDSDSMHDSLLLDHVEIVNIGDMINARKKEF